MIESDTQINPSNIRVKEIELINGGAALVDAEDYDLLVRRRWRKSSYGYAVSHVWSDRLKNTTTIFMHRVIMDAPKDKWVDHKNWNKLDNRRANLRLCNRCENQWNKGLIRTNSSGRKGVYFHKERGLWMARIMRDGTCLFLGRFKTSEEAGDAYDKAASEAHGEFAYMLHQKIA